MKGLEAVEIQKSDITNNFRLDSEFFKKEYLKIESRLSEIGSVNLETISKLHDGPFGSNFHSSGYVQQGVPIIRMQNIKESGLFNENDIEFVTEEDADGLSKHIAYPGEVVTTKIGFLGYTTVLPNLYSKYVFRREITRIQLQTNEVSTFFLSTFLNSKYGRKQFYRYASGTTRDRVLLINQKETLIPILSKDFQNSIERLLRNSYMLIEKAKTTYSNAESLLLDALGFQNFEISKEQVKIVNFKDSFDATGRIDSEYFQPKYSDYLRVVYNNPHGYESISEICEMKDKNYNPDTNKNYKYIELADIGNFGEITGSTVGLGLELPTRARRKVNTNDVIISSIEGSLESCAIVPDEYDNALCSTGFYVLKSNFINSETLLVLFKSEPIQNILKQNCSGTILTAINKADFLRIPIPIIDNQTQQAIRSIITESNQHRTKSELQLEVAKRAVELAIEKDEATAVSYIERINLENSLT